MARMRKGTKDDNRAGRICVSMIMLLFMAAMSVQIVKVYRKDQEYIAREAELEEQLESEQAREAELEDYEDYMNSQQYVEGVARSKLGLAYDNEIIFKEQK